MRKLCVFLLAIAAPCAIAQQTSAPATAPARLTSGVTVFIAPMDGFETYIAAAILKKHVPVVVVDSADKAQYVMSGSSHIQQAGWAKTIFVSPAPHAEASVTLKDAKTGTLVFAYNVDKFAANKGNQSTAEAVAKHLKETIESK